MDNAQYFVNFLGSTTHMDHPYINPAEAIFSPLHMEKIDKTFVMDLVKANSNLGIINNVMFERSRKNR